MCILFEICEKRPFQKCMGWGGVDDHIFEQMELQSGRCTGQGNARGTTDYSESESSPLLPPFHKGRDPIGAHIPLLVNWNIFFSFSQSCSLRALAGTHPVWRGMAHRPSVVRSTLRCLVSRTLRQAMVTLYPDFTQTKPGWACRFSGCRFSGSGVIPKSSHFILSSLIKTDMVAAC